MAINWNFAAKSSATSWSVRSCSRFALEGMKSSGDRGSLGLHIEKFAVMEASRPMRYCSRSLAALWRRVSAESWRPVMCQKSCSDKCKS